MGGRFTRFEGTEFGPPPKTITALLDGRDGFLWIGSCDGPALCDGTAGILFEHDLVDPASISDNCIRAVFGGSTGAIQVGTNSRKFTLSGDGQSVGYDSGDAISSRCTTPAKVRFGRILVAVVPGSEDARHVSG